HPLAHSALVILPAAASLSRGEAFNLERTAEPPYRALRYRDPWRSGPLPGSCIGLLSRGKPPASLQPGPSETRASAVAGCAGLAYSYSFWDIAGSLEGLAGYGRPARAKAGKDTHFRALLSFA